MSCALTCLLLAPSVYPVPQNSAILRTARLPAATSRNRIKPHTNSWMNRGSGTFLCGPAGYAHDREASAGSSVILLATQVIRPVSRIVEATHAFAAVSTCALAPRRSCHRHLPSATARAIWRRCVTFSASVESTRLPAPWQVGTMNPERTHHVPPTFVILPCQIMRRTCAAESRSERCPPHASSVLNGVPRAGRFGRQPRPGGRSRS